jgi:acyl-CoA synthetase (AMP-forming)/AMP-acid ligase II
VLVRDYLRRNAWNWPERTAYVSHRRRLSWAEVAERSWRLARALADRGVGPGDVVASMLLDSHETVEVFFAAATLGAVRTGINYRYAPREIAHILADARVSVLVVEGGDCEAAFRSAGAELPDLRLVVGIGEHGCPLDYEALLAQSAPTPPWPPLGPADRVAVSYTTGSTGLPKGVLWRHGAVVEVGVNTFFQAGMQHDEVFLHCLPAAGVPILLASWNVFNGACIVLQDRFTAAGSLRLLADERVTSVLWVPTMLADVLAHPAFADHDLSALRQVMYGSAPASPALVRRALDRFGCRLQQWYGATEATAGWTNILHHEDHLRALAGEPELLTSCGRATAHCEVAVLDDAGRPVPDGEIGEICVRSDTLMDGYLGLPGETAEALRDGWLHMGDLGRRDARGYFYLVDRKRFRIVTGGYNVYPTVVENVLAEHPAVTEVCVVGAPDQRWGEAVVAVVVPAGSVAATGEPAAALRAELLAFCRPRLATFELPKRIDLVDALPRGATGKVLKRAVRDRYWPAAAPAVVAPAVAAPAAGSRG